MQGQHHDLWRAVDQEGSILDILVQRRRDKRAVKQFFRKLLLVQVLELFVSEPEQLTSSLLQFRDSEASTFSHASFKLRLLYHFLNQFQTVPEQGRGAVATRTASIPRGMLRTGTLFIDTSPS
jgi:hypothetical protein